MKIKQDPITKLYCREDGAILMPPSKRFPKFRWTFGSKAPDGYRAVGYKGKHHWVHRIICRAFHGLPPDDKPFVDHIDRCKANNTPSNLRWASSKENNDNTDRVDKSVERYKARECEDPQAYQRAYNKDYYETYCEEIKAHQKAYWASKYAEKKAQGLIWKKGPDGKYGWHPRICT